MELDEVLEIAQDPEDVNYNRRALEKALRGMYAEHERLLKLISQASAELRTKPASVTLALEILGEVAS
jgi:hypothetical protein